MATLILLVWIGMALLPAMKLIPLSKWPEIHTWPSENTLRSWYRRDYRNFRSVTLRGPGEQGRILIRESAFFTWVETNRQDGEGTQHGDAA